MLVDFLNGHRTPTIVMGRDFDSTFIAVTDLVKLNGRCMQSLGSHIYRQIPLKTDRHAYNSDRSHQSSAWSKFTGE